MMSKSNRLIDVFQCSGKLVSQFVFKKNIRIVVVTLCVLLASLMAHAENSAVIIQDFESGKLFKTQTTGVSRVKHKNSDAVEGKYGALWDTSSQASISLFLSSHDWSASQSIQFSIHSEVSNSQRVRMSFFSQNLDTEGDDYYEYTFYVDWVGWKTFNLPFSSLPTAREPLGFQHIDKITLRAYEPAKGEKQKLIIDDLILTKDLVMPSVFGDNMIIQRNKPVNIYGESFPGQSVQMTFASTQTPVSLTGLMTVADSQGKWQFILPSTKEGGPYELKVKTVPLSSTDRGSERTISNIYFGDVFYISGQANVEMALTETQDGDAEVRRANYPQVRILTVERSHSDVPVESVSGIWNIITPATMKKMPALAYYFARDLHKQTKVPVGIIVAAYNSTPIYSWISQQGLSSDVGASLYKKAVKDFADIRAIRNAPADSALHNTVRAGELLNKAYRQPTAAYNGMVNPFVDFPISGVILYQGESDVRNSTYRFRELLPDLITDWRKHWNDPELPFFIVQLQNYKSRSSTPENSAWAEIREAQALAAEKLPRVLLVPIIDLGDANDVTPKEKAMVGRRVMVSAFKELYNYDGPDTGPTFTDVKIQGSKMVLSFDNIAGGLILNKVDTPAFAVADSSGHFYWADNVVFSGNTVVVSSSKVSSPKYVRYAWSDNPSTQLMNSIGLPAHPFRTDSFPSVYTKK